MFDSLDGHALLSSWDDPIGHLTSALLQGGLCPIVASLLGVESSGSGISLDELLTQLRERFPLCPTDEGVQSHLLWVGLPGRAAHTLVSQKIRHLCLLLKQYRSSPVWTLLAVFVRKALGHTVAQLQIVVVMLFVAARVAEYEDADTESKLNPAQLSKPIVRCALENFAARITSPETANRTEAFAQAKQFFSLASLLQLHPSDCMRMLSDAGDLLADIRDEIVTVAQRLRSPQQAHPGGGQRDFVAGDKDEPFQHVGRFHALEHSLDLLPREAFVALATSYASTTIYPLANAQRRNEGLSPLHIQLLNDDFCPAVVELLTKYQAITASIGAYRDKTVLRNAVSSTQLSLGAVHVGLQQLAELVPDLMNRTHEVVAGCRALQFTLKSLSDWLSNGAASTDSRDGAEQEKKHRGTNSDRVFLQQWMITCDVVVDAILREIRACENLLCAVEDSAVHILTAHGKLGHEQSVRLFVLAQLVARVLDEVRALARLEAQESTYLSPLSVTSWKELATGCALETAEGKRALLLLASTAALLHDGCCKALPTLLLMQESVEVQVEAVAAEQKTVAAQLGSIHEALQQMQSESIRFQEAGLQPRRGAAAGALRGTETPSATRHESILSLEAKARQSKRDPGALLEVRQVAELLCALFDNYGCVAEVVHNIMSSLRELEHPDSLVCFDTVACFCTVVELLSKWIFQAKT